MGLKLEHQVVIGIWLLVFGLLGTIVVATLITW